MRSTLPDPPDRTYWADPGRLLAGAYPGDARPEVAEQKIRALLVLGVRTFVNLMEEDETDSRGRPFAAYEPHVEPWSREAGAQVACMRHPIRDLGVPSIARMREIQATIDRSVSWGRPVYVHCWGGRGRTGTAVGVYLIGRELATADDFVSVIARLRANDAGGGRSPETHEQVEFVRRYVASLRKSCGSA